MNKQWWYILGGIGGILLIGGIASAKKTTKSKRLYFPNDTVEAFMGQLFTVRLPRGEYTVVAENVIATSSVPAGTFSDVTLLAGASHAQYGGTVRFIDKISGREFKVQVNVKELPVK